MAQPKASDEEKKEKFFENWIGKSYAHKCQWMVQIELFRRWIFLIHT